VTSSTPTGPRALPGGRARKVVARLLPRKLKASLRRRFRGSYLFPAPPPKPRRGRGPVPRVVTLPRPGAPDGAPLVLEAPKHLHVPRRLESEGLAGYEPHALECFLALLVTAGPGAVIDVGANVGLYALLAAACSDREVRAFEPTPDLAALARAAAARNDLRIVVEELALGREPGSATLFLSDASDSSNSLAVGYRPSSGSLDVPVDTLDAYCARTGVVPAVLKVDTETTEPDVLAGAAATIARHRPWILCEVLHARRPGELAEVLAPHGYTWYHLCGDAGHTPVATLDGDPDHVDLMYLLAPEPVDAAFWRRTAAWRAALDATRPEPAEVVLPTAPAVALPLREIALPGQDAQLEPMGTERD
jgi:FkbM family methyltransferase